MAVMLTTMRRATPDDADRVAELARRNFVESFGHHYPPQDLETFLETHYTAPLQYRVLEDPRRVIWLVEEGQDAIGQLYVGPCELPHPEASLKDFEIKRLYILKRAHNQGWGGKLMQRALEWIALEQSQRIWVGVWSENLGAQRFYRRYGFEKIGDYFFEVGETRDHEWIMRRECTGS